MSLRLQHHHATWAYRGGVIARVDSVRLTLPRPPGPSATQERAVKGKDSTLPPTCVEGLSDPLRIHTHAGFGDLPAQPAMSTIFQDLGLPACMGVADLYRVIRLVRGGFGTIIRVQTRTGSSDHVPSPSLPTPLPCLGYT